MRTKQQCRLLPYKRHDIVSAQDISEKLGWGITSFNIPEIWKATQGDGVVVGVIDSGCQLDHIDIKDNLLPGRNFIHPNKDPEDEISSGHGSHVTGIICAELNGIGVVGVAPKAKVRPIKVLDEDGNGTINHVIQGIKWAIEQKVDFISLSLGTDKADKALHKAIQQADQAGITIFCAAGNIGKSEHLLYPSNFPETLAIGSIDKNLKRADFSNTGRDRYLDFMAPGVDILSTVPHNSYAVMSGSSMSQPYVCGLAALLLSYKRNVGLDIPLNCANDYRNFFKNNTIDIIGEGYAGDPFYQGFGIITPEKLIALLPS